MGELRGKSTLIAPPGAPGVVTLLREDYDRMVLVARRRRSLLIDVAGYLQRPGPPERQLDRRCRLVARIRELCDE